MKKKGVLFAVVIMLMVLTVTSFALMFSHTKTTGAGGYYLNNTIEKWSNSPDTIITFQAINYSYTYPWRDVFHNSPQGYNAASQYNDSAVYRNGVYVARKTGSGSNTSSILTRINCGGSYYDIWGINSYSSCSYPSGTLAVYNYI